MNRIYQLFILLFLYSQQMEAQFILNGSASQLDEDCFVLTPDQTDKGGSAWYQDKINLNQSFDISMKLNFGSKDADGADGIVFILQPISTSIGTFGSGIGFEGIQPSIGIEFDTWQNGINNDPGYDHLAILRDGLPNHNLGLTNPIAASPNSSNIEDGEFHSVRITWDAGAKILEVFFDCDKRQSLQLDLVNSIFNNDPLVYWGFSSATGGFANKHQICFEFIEFNQVLESFVLCPGGDFPIEGPVGNYTYSWSPIEGLSDPTISNPIANPSEDTQYILELTDECGYVFYDTLEITIGDEPNLVELGEDTILCDIDSYLLDADVPNSTFIWQDGSTLPQFNAVESGNYSVTIEVNNNCLDWEDISLDFRQSPDRPLLDPNLIKCQGNPLLIDAAIPQTDALYDWSTGDNSSISTVEAPGTYDLIISNYCGLQELRFFVEEEDCSQSYAPNIFSPNNDGINDYFTIYGTDITIIESLKVFDRWGNLVFENNSFPANQPDKGWNGKTNGNRCTAGTYVWKASVVFKDEKTRLLKGPLQLYR